MASEPGVGKSYVVRKGDALDGIAAKFGHRDPEVIWKADENRSLVSKRKKPDAVQPGDTLFIPPNAKELKEIKRQLAGLNVARDTDAQLREALGNELDRVKRRLDIFPELIKAMREATESQVKELEDTLSDMRRWGDGVDAAAKVATICVSLAKLTSIGAKAAKAAGEELGKLNKEALKEAVDLAKQPLEDVAKKAASDALKMSGKAGLQAVHVVLESWEKMVSPKFWANTFVLLKEGKSWSGAVSSEVGEDIEERIRTIKADGDKQVRALQEQLQDAKRALPETQALIRECEARITSFEREAEKLSG